MKNLSNHKDTAGIRFVPTYYVNEEGYLFKTNPEIFPPVYPISSSKLTQITKEEYDKLNGRVK